MINKIRVALIYKDDNVKITCEKINKISPWGYQDIEEFLTKSKEKGLDHIVVDDMNNGPEYIQEIFSNEEKYLFLEKVFDSKKVGYNYHVKIFRINYEMLEGEK